MLGWATEECCNSNSQLETHDLQIELSLESRELCYQSQSLSIWPHGNGWVDTFVALWSHHSWGPWPPSAVGNDLGVQVVPSYSDFSKLCGSSVSWPREVTAEKSLSTKECKENTQQWLGALLVNLPWFLETQSICNIPAVLTNKQS